YMVVPRGVALVFGCSTFPNWNAYPGLFASLACGNPVIVKPHPGAVLPLAITVAVARQVLKEAGQSPDLVSLLADAADKPVARDAALNPDVRLIDYTGGGSFAAWLLENARQARVSVAQAGVNGVVVDSTDDYAGMLRNLAFSLCLFSGQMGTTPQAIFVPRDGIGTPAGRVASGRFGVDLALAVGQLLRDDPRAMDILGAIQSPSTRARIEALAAHGEVLRESESFQHPVWPSARIATPLLLAVGADEQVLYGEERFGPVGFVVESATTVESLAGVERLVRSRGAHNLSVHTTNPHVQDLAEELAWRAGVSVSFNLTGGAVVNLSHAFSDFHSTGANPAANASMTDAAFVAGRFFVVQVRRPV
ncbi:MAG: aldehyde dehydrogenase family protein, partial [Rhodocyclaceae bacterium]|nr:aldehyde dehydrogenase family protein [Rhodocyclaceae bacterium]